MKKIGFILLLVVGLMALPMTAMAAGGPPDHAKNEKPICMIPNGGDQDNNGIGDVDIQVVCNYTSVYAYDYSGGYYWDLGDGRVYGTVGSIGDLDQETLTVCNYHVHTRGTFQNDPYMDSGEINNMINCQGVDNGSYYYQIVSQDDPRYTGNPAWAIWGTWEYHVNVEFNLGNIVQHSVQP